MSDAELKDLTYKHLLELFTEEGILASSRSEVYGCVFGRDSALTILKVLNVCSKYPDEHILKSCKNALLTLVSLQGKDVNVESGEEPGKFIHEYRKDKFDHLVNRDNPWFIYPEGVLKNYDSIDSTPLVLIAIYRYWKITGDNEFLNQVLPAVENGLNWIITYGDQDKDVLIEYSFPFHRRYGGLLVQSWTDSHESIMQKNGSMPKYPIAPIEVQGYAWLSLKIWSDYFSEAHTSFALKLLSQADKMKQEFNDKFIFKNDGLYFGVQALDGDKNQIQTVTGNPLILLWATFNDNGKKESIIDEKYILDFVERAFKSDLFDASAGIRTMSTKSPTFNNKRDSYHNGSFWPVLNGLIYEGLNNWGFDTHAKLLKDASLQPIRYFQSPIELYIKDENGEYAEYLSPTGQVSCRVQAWSAAVAWELTNDLV